MAQAAEAGARAPGVSRSARPTMILPSAHAAPSRCPYAAASGIVRDHQDRLPEPLDSGRAGSPSTAFEFSVSRLPVGSSASRIAGWFTTARAIATRCCSPPESAFGL